MKRLTAAILGMATVSALADGYLAFGSAARAQTASAPIPLGEGSATVPGVTAMNKSINTGYPIASYSSYPVISSSSAKCPLGYTVVYTSRAMCAKELKEPE